MAAGAFLIVYDESGNEVIEERDDDQDGNLDRRVTYEWKDYGEVVRIDYDSFTDGAADILLLCNYTFDENGRMLNEAFDVGDDGTVDFRNTYTYECSL